MKPEYIILTLTFLLIIVFKKAWQLLKEKPLSGFNLDSAYEDAITRELVEIIKNILRQSGKIDHSLISDINFFPQNIEAFFLLNIYTICR